MIQKLDKTKATAGDGVTYRIPSRSKPHETHFVDLLAYNGNGQCTCPDFLCRREPFIRRMVKPEKAIKEGLVKARPGVDSRDALRCYHLIEGRRQFIHDVIKAIIQKDRDEAGE